MNEKETTTLHGNTSDRLHSLQQAITPSIFADSRSRAASMSWREWNEKSMSEHKKLTRPRVLPTPTRVLTRDTCAFNSTSRRWRERTTSSPAAARTISNSSAVMAESLIGAYGRGVLGQCFAVRKDAAQRVGERLESGPAVGRSRTEENDLTVLQRPTDRTLATSHWADQVRVELGELPVRMSGLMA